MAQFPFYAVIHHADRIYFRNGLCCPAQLSSHCNHHQLSRPAVRRTSSFKLFLVYAMSSIALTTFLITMLIALSTPCASTELCRVNMIRIIGKTDAYVWNCDDMRPEEDRRNGEEKVSARIQVDAPPIAESSTSRVQRTRKCMEDAINHDEHLSNCCADPRGWEKLGSVKMRECIHQSARDGDLDERFQYDRGDCSAVFATLKAAKVAAVWVCFCDQPRAAGALAFEIVVGRAQFVVERSPTSPVGEVAFVKRCTRSAFPDIRRVCRETPGQFNRLSEHWMQTCCKRARRLFKDDKFECAAIVT